MKELEQVGDIEEQEQERTDKFVPVVESIRYRKRAQAAEKRSEELEMELSEVRSLSDKMQSELKDVKIEKELMEMLSQAGVVDMEAALLLAKQRLGKDGDAKSCVEKLRLEKGFLFADSLRQVTRQMPTAGARDKVSNKEMALSRAAKRAATTGNRSDLQEYLRMRRKF